jgi:multiple sugar transport system substrate-binding protein
MTTIGTAISRRTLLFGSAALGGYAALGSLASKAATGPVRFGIFGNAQKLEIRGKSIARFNELHPDIPVTFEGIPSASWPDKIAAMVAGGNAPDVITLGGADLPQYASRGALSPLDEFAPAILRTDLFDKTVLDLGRVDDKIYGVPIAVSIQGLAYNQSALERLGMGNPPTAWTYDEFAKFCADIHGADQSIYGSHDGAARLDTFQMYLISQGRSLYSGQELVVTVDEVAAWLDYWDKMRKSGGAVPADLQAQFTGTEWPNSPLVKGKAVFASIASQDLAGGYQALVKDTLSITTPPSVGAGGSPGCYPQPTSSLCLYSESQNKEAAVKVIDWFVSDPESAKILGLISGPPASKPALEAVLGLQGLAAVDQRVLKYSQAALAKAQPAPPSQVAARAIEDLMRRVNEDVGFGTASVKDAAQAFVDQGNALMRRA